MLKELSIATVAVTTLCSAASAQSYAAAGVVVGDNQAEESALVRYDVPGAPVSVRGQYTSLETPEGALSVTYDSTVGVYVGVGVGADFSDEPGILTEEAGGEAIAFAQIGYERFIGQNSVIGVDYKRSLADDTYAITGFAGLTF